MKLKRVREALRQAGLGADPKQQVVTWVEKAIGRDQLWRLGRLAYLHARRDGPNNPDISGEYQLQEQIVACCAQRGSRIRVFDIGANTGFWAEHMLRACDDGGLTDVRLWAFEPSDDPRQALTESLGRWTGTAGEAVATIRPDAVADTVGSARFDATPGLGQSKSIVSEAGGDEDNPSATPSTEVPLTTVDHLMQELELDAVDFIKSDVEGFDLHVLKGASATLRDGRVGVLQFEYNHRWVGTRSFLRDVFALVDGLPYLLCKIVPEGIEHLPAWHHEIETFFEANYLLVHHDWAAGLGVYDGGFDRHNTYQRRDRLHRV